MEHIKEDTRILKGLIHKNSVQLQRLNDNVVNLTAQSMRHNVTISGLLETDKELPRAVVNDFLSNTMNLSFDPKDIWVAHRIGQAGGSKPRLMVVRCTPELKLLILQNAKHSRV